MVPINELKKAEYNPRKISENEMRRLKKSIQEFGFVDPVIANKRTGRENIIIGGHQRIEAAKELGYVTVPVTYVDLDEEKEKMLNTALNRISGEWDEDKLVQLLIDLDKKNADLTLTGFTDREIDRLLTDFREGKEEEMPSEIQQRVKYGDIWQLGDHTVICGDCTDPDHVKELVGNELIDLVLTDPPYNIGLDYRSPLVNDNLPEEKYLEWCKKWFELCEKISDRILITSGIWNIKTWFEIKKPRWILCWYRRNSQSRSVLKGFTNWEPIMLYHKHEQIFFYGNTEKIVKTDTYVADYNSIDDVYDINTAFYEDSGETLGKGHPCPKPVKLWASLIKDFTNSKNKVIDVFLGSGTALIAAEKTKRICYGMEISPEYMNLALARWEAYTGKKAEFVRNIMSESVGK